MRWRKVLIPTSILGVVTAIVVVAFCSGHHPEVSAKILRVEGSTDDMSLARVTVQFTNPGSALIWFGPHQGQQAKVGVEWLTPQGLDGLSNRVMEPGTNLDIVIAVPKAAQACRLLLSYGDTPQRTQWAWFCSRHDKICGEVPKLCFWVGQRLRPDPKWRSRAIELVLPESGV